MTLPERAAAILISVLVTSVSAFFMAAARGGYMAWTFAQIAALIAVPIAAVSTLVWHFIGRLCFARISRISGDRSRAWPRAIIVGLLVVVATAVLTGLLLNLRSGFPVAMVAVPLSLGGAAYVPTYLWRAATNAPSRFSKSSDRTG